MCSSNKRRSFSSNALCKFWTFLLHPLATLILPHKRSLCLCVTSETKPYQDRWIPEDVLVSKEKDQKAWHHTARYNKCALSGTSLQAQWKDRSNGKCPWQTSTSTSLEIHYPNQYHQTSFPRKKKWIIEKYWNSFSVRETEENLHITLLDFPHQECVRC